MRVTEKENIISDRSMRDNCVSHYEVLEKVKKVLLIPDTEWATQKQVAEYYEAEVEETTKNLTAMLEPLVIVVLAVLVGGILGAVMMPMLSLYENAGNA